MTAQSDSNSSGPSGSAGVVVMIFWIIGITVVAVFGPAWIAALMIIVAAGGRPVARALTRLFRWFDPD